MTGSDAVDRTLTQWQRGAAVVAVVGGVLCGVAVLSDREQFLRSYLVGFLFWWAVTMGCLGVLMLYYLVDGRWGAAARPLLECGSRIAPLTAVLFLPVAVSVSNIYPWAGSSAASEQQALYLNPPFFYGRAAGYFVAWTVLAILLCRRSSAESERPRGRRRLSAGGLVLLILTVTFAAIDWAMSLDPAWFSTIYGALVAMGGALAALALVTLTLAALQWRQPPASSIVPPTTLADLGSLMLAFLMMWTYFAFSQFLIIWSGNLPDENIWYVQRLGGGWQWLALAIVVLQFFVPFFLLLSRGLKENPRTLASIAALLFVMQFFYFLWAISPTFHPGRIFIHWADLVAPVAIGGLWCSIFIWLARRSEPSAIEGNPS